MTIPTKGSGEACRRCCVAATEWSGLTPVPEQPQKEKYVAILHVATDRLLLPTH
jgi:hypothetical protein